MQISDVQRGSGAGRGVMVFVEAATLKLEPMRIIPPLWPGMLAVCG